MRAGRRLLGASLLGVAASALGIICVMAFREEGASWQGAILGTLASWAFAGLICVLIWGGVSLMGDER